MNIEYRSDHVTPCTNLTNDFLSFSLHRQKSVSLQWSLRTIWFLPLPLILFHFLCSFLTTWSQTDMSMLFGHIGMSLYSASHSNITFVKFSFTIVTLQFCAHLFLVLFFFSLLLNVKNSIQIVYSLSPPPWYEFHEDNVFCTFY
jgi:hypothetical protein